MPAPGTNGGAREAGRAPAREAAGQTHAGINRGELGRRGGGGVGETGVFGRLNGCGCLIGLIGGGYCVCWALGQVCRD